MTNDALRKARVQRNWTQSALAIRLNTSRITVARWEQGQTLPSLYYREQLCETFGLTSLELGLEAPSAEMGMLSQPICSLPEKRNLFFTGRTASLEQIHTTLRASDPSQIFHTLIINGIGGIGKTQLALEYAHHFSAEYTSILWLHADTTEMLYAEIARHTILLQLSIKQDKQQTIQAFTNWLSQARDWLLIFDHVEDIALISDLLPAQETTGHVLITTRSRATGRHGWPINLDVMSTAEGALFILRRTRLLTSQQTLNQASEEQGKRASELCELLGGLTLALDQAGAYIEETGCGLTGYLERLKEHRMDLLSRRGHVPGTSSTAITINVQQTCEQIQQRSPLARDIIHLCLFIQAHSIPEQLIIEGARHLEPALQQATIDLLSLDEAFAILNATAILQRNPEKHQLSLHPLVQSIIRAQLDQSTKYLCIERVLNTLEHLFPNTPAQQVITWPLCEQLLPHILCCLDHVESISWEPPQEHILIVSATLLHKIAEYMLERGRNQEATSITTRLIMMEKQISNPTYQSRTTSLIALDRSGQASLL
jgi:transcriptional regulator with XRE-family HTH domain